MTLYELGEQYRALLEMSEDEIPEDVLADTLDGLKGEIEAKADGICCLIKELSAESTAIKAEEERLAARRKAKDALQTRLKAYLSSELTKAGMSGFESSKNKVSFRSSESAALVCDKEQFIEWAQKHGDEYLKYSEPAINVAAVKAAMKSGTDVYGFELRRNANIQIK